MLLLIQNKEITIKDAIIKAKTKIKVVIFKIKIAKQHIEENEEAPYRFVALPLGKYEPWTKIIYDYFKKRGGKPVFPFSRTDVCDYITRKDKVFKDLTYRIKKHVYLSSKCEDITIEELIKIREDLYEKLLYLPVNRNGMKIVVYEQYEYRMDISKRITRKRVYKVLSHQKPLKIHGLRHIRTDELLRYKGFDGVDLVAYVGWSCRGVALPVQAGNYAEIRENWQRYIKKLCVV